MRNAVTWALGITGWVILEGRLNRYGRIENAKVRESSPPGVFDHSAVTVWPKWQYCPTTYPDLVVIRLDYNL